MEVGCTQPLREMSYRSAEGLMQDCDARSFEKMAMIRV
jgi:hypothetical protein